MQKQIFLYLFIITIILFSCNSKEQKDNFKHVVYRAINNKDTATLSININEKRFFGHYEISRHRFGKDSGDVRGDMKGDTLRGDFHYIGYGGSWKRIPLALLKKENKLFSGTGVIGTYLNLPCFMPETPIDYSNPEFVFEELKAPEK